MNFGFEAPLNKKEIKEMSEILVERLKKSVGSYAKIFLHNGFKFEGKITNCDDKYVELLEDKGYKIIEIKDISDADISIGNKGVGE